MTDTIKTTHPVIANPQVTRHIMKAFNLRAAKKLGQNFLVDAGRSRCLWLWAYSPLSAVRS